MRRPVETDKTHPLDLQVLLSLSFLIRSDVSGLTRLGKGDVFTRMMAAFERAATDADAEEEEKVCRVCKEATEPDTMIAPCDCTGTMKWIHSNCWDRSERRCVPCRRNPRPENDGEPNFTALHLLFDSLGPPRTAVQQTGGGRDGTNLTSMITAMTPLLSALFMPMVDETVSQIRQVSSARLRLANTWSGVLESRALKVFALTLMAYIVIYLTMHLLVMGRMTYVVLSG